MSYNPYVGRSDVPPPDGITLQEYAAAWIDMEPHIDQLTILARDAKVIVEFGIRGGVSSWALLDGLANDGHLYGVDIIPDRQWYNENFPEWRGYSTPIPPRVRLDPRFIFIVGNSVKVSLPEHADLVMIDSSHEYWQTVLEINRAAELTPSVIALHDYLYSETTSVARAVDEFVVDGSYRLDTVFPSKWGLAILVPK